MATMKLTGPPESTWTFPGGRVLTFGKSGSTSLDLSDIEVQQAVSAGLTVEAPPKPKKAAKGDDDAV